MSEATYTARYWRHFSECEEDCDSLDDAVAFLANGWANGDLSEISIDDRAGETVLAGDELHQRMWSALGNDRQPSTGGSAT
ncbi:hypothetical protein [Streptomyces sp. 351MFTsu5.1]|uniref:hypothetical protein n=1 Tax=Streptomyces sp. 351MFTsu5.1 TaxID=1172180 RepID=UPI000367A78F|nr:hypothetical protein [Streptomyces sp. 351MFTsu5.1]